MDKSSAVRTHSLCEDPPRKTRVRRHKPQSGSQSTKLDPKTWPTWRLHIGLEPETSMPRRMHRSATTRAGWGHPIPASTRAPWPCGTEGPGARFFRWTRDRCHASIQRPDSGAKATRCCGRTLRFLCRRPSPQDTMNGVRGVQRGALGAASFVGECVGRPVRVVSGAFCFPGDIESDRLPQIVAMPVV